MKNAGGRPFPPSGRGAEDLDQEDVGVLLRGDAAAEFGVERGLVVDVAILIERADDVGGVLAEGELGLLLRFVVRRGRGPEQDQCDQWDEEDRRECGFHGTRT